MTTQVWKEFEDHQITHSMAHYLMAIQDLLKSQGYARVTDVARELEITPGSASVSIKALKSKGYVSEDKNRFLGLTDLGEKIAHDVHVANRSFILFFTEILGVDEHTAEVDSCKIEHLVSEETRQRLMLYLKYAMGKDAKARAFRYGFRHFHVHCDGPDACKLCEENVCELQCIEETEGK